MRKAILTLLLSLPFMPLTLTLAVADPAVTSEVENLRSQVQSLQKTVEQLQRAVAELQKKTRAQEKTAELERELAAQMGSAQPPPVPVTSSSSSPSTARSTSILNPNLSVVGDFSLNLTDNDKELEINPNPNEIRARDVEVTFQAAVDPYARFDLFVDLIEAEALAEVEEAYGTTLSLPYNLQVRVGKFRTNFGKLNLTHDHALPQVDRPNVLINNLGDEGLFELGLGVSYLFPTRHFIQFSLEGLDGLGEFQEEIEEFLESASAEEEGRKGPDRGLGNFAYVPRLQTFFDLSDDSSLDLGISGLIWAPGRLKRFVEGFDLTYRWRPLRQAGYKQFLWRSEFLFTQGQFGKQSFDAFGFYTYGEYRLGQRWWAGTRFDYNEVPILGTPEEWGITPYLTFQPSEFQLLRLQYKYNDADTSPLKQFHQALLQWQFNLGPHGAHAF